MKYSHDQIKMSVKNFIAQTFYFNNTTFSLADDTSFMDNGILDSTGVMELTSFIQDYFKIRMSDNEIIPENLDSLNNIAEFIMKKQFAS